MYVSTNFVQSSLDHFQELFLDLALYRYSSTNLRVLKKIAISSQNNWKSAVFGILTIFSGVQEECFCTYLQNRFLYVSTYFLQSSLYHFQELFLDLALYRQSSTNLRVLKKNRDLKPKQLKIDRFQYFDPIFRRTRRMFLYIPPKQILVCFYKLLCSLFCTISRNGFWIWPYTDTLAQI